MNDKPPAEQAPAECSGTSCRIWKVQEGFASILNLIQIQWGSGGQIHQRNKPLLDRRKLGLTAILSVRAELLASPPPNPKDSARRADTLICTAPHVLAFPGTAR